MKKIHKQVAKDRVLCSNSVGRVNSANGQGRRASMADGDVTCLKCQQYLKKMVGRESPYKNLIDAVEESVKSGLVSANTVRNYLGWKVRGYCGNCGNKILVAIFRGGVYCSDDCRKALGLDRV